MQGRHGGDVVSRRARMSQARLDDRGVPRAPYTKLGLSLIGD